tara:strand:+ start:600 stop:1610 length:1011 start_codon:yes stop_codon:yes gene_type:complete
MATKQNGVLATFTPTVSKYTNETLPANGNTVAATGYNIYTCPGATLMSGKLFVSNNTGGALDIDVGIVEQSDVIQLDAATSQPGSPQNYTSFVLGSGQQTGYTSSIVIDYASLSGTFVVGEQISWTNSNRSPSAQTAILQYHDTVNGRLWLRDMSHPLGLDLPGDTTFTGAGGATCAVGPSHAGTGGTQGWSGLVRYFDPLNGTIYFLNREFRNNLNYANIYDVNNENRELGNNNVERSLSKYWRPVTTTQTRYAAAGNTTPATEFIDNNGVELLVSSVTQATTEQLIVNGLQVADNSVKEISGILLGTYQSLYVKSTGAVTFTLVGLEEQAEIPS